MNNRIQISTLFILCMFLSISMFAQTKNWVTQKTDDGSVTVKSCISEHKNDKGNKVPLIEYTATATLQANFQNCLSTIKNIPNHKVFLRDVKDCELIKSISENESVVYYSFNAPWPFSDYDCVSKMTFHEDSKTKIAIFTQTAEPTLYKKTVDDRLTQRDITYQFKDFGNGKVEFTIIGKMSPLIKIPLWMLRNTMPDHPADVIKKIVNLEKEMKNK